MFPTPTPPTVRAEAAGPVAQLPALGLRMSSRVTAHKVQQGILVVTTGVALEEGGTCGLEGGVGLAPRLP